MGRIALVMAGKGAGAQACPDLEDPLDYGKGCLGKYYKAEQIRVHGRTLMNQNIHAFAGAETPQGKPAYDLVIIGGPERHFGKYVGRSSGLEVELFDTDHTLAQNMKNWSDHLIERFPNQMVTYFAGDLCVLPKHLTYLESIIQQHENDLDGMLFLMRKEAVSSAGFRKRIYTLADEGGDLRFAFGQVYAARPGKVNWPVLIAGAEFGYRIRKRGFLQVFSRENHEKIRIAYEENKCAGYEAAPVVKSAVRGLLRLAAGTPLHVGLISRTEIERRAAPLLLKPHPDVENRFALIPILNGHLAADIDYEKDIERAERSL